MEFRDFALLRFGAGLSPRHAGPETPTELLASLDSAGMMRRFPIIGSAEAARLRNEYQTARRREVKEQTGSSKPARDAINRAADDTLRARLARAVEDPTGFSDRLTQFWLSHFSLRGSALIPKILSAPFADDAIRANLNGSFGDMLRAATLHPGMLVYLDQTSSVGPRSPFAMRRKKQKVGINENHARELLELHTLGVGGNYSQQHVRELAELMTGLVVDGEGLFAFDTRRVEPGAETVLGVEYGGGRPPQLSEIEAFLDDIAIHPDTAAHISHKLAAHFCADVPPAALTRDLTEVFLATKGDLLSLYAVLVQHPEAHSTFGQKLRQPYDLLMAGLRALGISGDEIMAWRTGQLHSIVIQPLVRMGQSWLGAPSPEGWPESTSAWLTPQFLAARISWAMRQPRRVMRPLPDPRQFVDTALGSLADEPLRLAASRAESQTDGVGIVLASPQFNRR